MVINAFYAENIDDVHWTEVKRKISDGLKL